MLTSQSAREIKMFWSASERKLALDGQPVKKLTDYLGVLRTVVFCTEDLQLVKGAARARRRFLDLLLAQTQPGYLPLLQRYMRAVRARNALLKQRADGRGRARQFFAGTGEARATKSSAPAANWRRNFPRWRGWRIAAFPTTRRNCALNISPA